MTGRGGNLSQAVVVTYITDRMTTPSDGYVLKPDPLDSRLTERVTGIDQTGAAVTMSVVVERALTIYLNAQEIVTAMTIGDYPDYLAIGYLLNQNMLQPDDVVTGVDYDEELAVVVVRTERATNYEAKLKKRVQTSGCAQGTAFGDLMDVLDEVKLPRAELRTSWLYALTNKINTTPSLYLEAGAIHGCILAREDRPLVYMEDVGRHNAVDKIAGWMFTTKERADDKIFYTTGRLTSEMVLKTVRMGIPILVSRSGFTAWGVELARKANLTLIGRARGKRFIALAGQDRIVFDQDLAYVEDESAKHRRKASVHDDGRVAIVDVRLRMSEPEPQTFGLVLAGGLARRMGGGDKVRLRIGNATILERVLERLTPQCSGVVINANGDAQRFADTGLPVVSDDVPGFAGPLAGILAVLDWAAANAPQCEWIVSVPGDCPFLPRDIVARLHRARAEGGAVLACARSGAWRHPVVGLWPTRLRADLRHALVDEDLRKIEVWTARHGVALATWPDQPVDPFYNVNTPDDAAKAGQLACDYPEA